MKLNFGNKTLMTLENGKSILYCLMFIIVLAPFITFFFLWWLFGGKIKLTWTGSDKVRYLRWLTIKG
jgi:hypothetical protein